MGLGGEGLGQLLAFFGDGAQRLLCLLGHLPGQGGGAPGRFGLGVLFAGPCFALFNLLALCFASGGFGALPGLIGGLQHDGGFAGGKAGELRRGL